jgi:hypothetical protein
MKTFIDLNSGGFLEVGRSSAHAPVTIAIQHSRGSTPTIFLTDDEASCLAAKLMAAASMTPGRPAMQTLLWFLRELMQQLDAAV